MSPCAAHHAPLPPKIRPSLPSTQIRRSRPLPNPMARVLGASHLDRNTPQPATARPELAGSITGVTAKDAAERAAREESCAGKKARVESEAKAAASKITITLDHKLLECSACGSALAPPLFQGVVKNFITPTALELISGCSKSVSK